jgi:hypothetical protein
MKIGTQKGGFSSSKITTSSDGNNVTITIPKSALNSNYSGVDGTEGDSSDKKGYLMLAGMGLILIGVIYYGSKLVKG